MTTDYRLEKARPYLGVLNDNAVADKLSTDYGIVVGADVVCGWRRKLGIPAAKRHNNSKAPDPKRADEHKRWAKLYADGESVHNISRKCGVCYTHVLVALQALGVVPSADARSGTAG